MRSEKTIEAPVTSYVNRPPSSLTLSRALRGIKRHLQLARHGIFYLPGHDMGIRSIRVAGRAVPVMFPESERITQCFELVSLVYLDCYNLSRVRGPVSTVLDIGANLGFFALAARRKFPHARIHCYEPNQDLESNLSTHCSAVEADYFIAAVGASAGRVSLDCHENTLHTISRESAEGATPQIAFAEAVNRLGTVDLLKLDCEGAEWDIFSDPRPWRNVRHLTMEYHLWARPSLSVNDVRRNLSTLGFSKIVIEAHDGDDWGMAWASKE